MADEDGLPAPFDDDLFRKENQYQFAFAAAGEEREGGKQHTFLPSGMAAKSISTFACASTSAEADMLTRKSAFDHPCQPLRCPNVPLQAVTSSDTPSDPSRMFTLHGSLRPRRRQQPHPPNHEILKRLV